MAKMKAGVYHAIKNVTLDEVDVPEMGENDVLVKMLKAGICGSDSGAWLHGGIRYGVWNEMVEGHEGVGKICAKGANVSDDLSVGDIVFVEPMKAHLAGKIEADVLGTFGEYILVQNAKRDYNVFVLKPDVDLDLAAIVEPLAVGTQGALCTNPQPEDNVVVLGAGTIGLCAAAGLINHGIKNVVVVDRNEWKLEIARKIGAKTVNSREENVAEKLCEYFGEFLDSSTKMQFANPKIFQQLASIPGLANRVAGKKPNVQLYVDCAGAKELLMQSLGMCAEGTKYVIVSVYNEDLAINGGMFMSEPKIVGSAGYTQETIKEVIDHIENERTAIKSIVTEQISINEIETALLHAADKSFKNIKVIMNFD